MADTVELAVVQTEYFERKTLELLEQVLVNQDEQRAEFEQFREDVLEKLDNINVSLPGDGFSIEG